MVRALITGDRGFLGRHFKAELQRRGWDVVGWDTKATHAQDCRLFFQQQARHPGHDWTHFDLVVHCAAVVGGRETIERDPLATAESLSIDAEMFRWAAVARPGRVLYISSSAAYPVSLQAGPSYVQQKRIAEGSLLAPRVESYRLHEDDLWGPDGMIEPDEVYGWSKVTGELLADRLRAAGVPVTVVRPFSGYGEDQDPSYPFRAILERVKAGENPLEVWCGDCTRDWIHVDDVVAGALAVADSGTEAPVNLCTGRATSFALLAGMMLQAAGREGETTIRTRPDMPQGVAYRVGDPNRMRTIYLPKVSLEEGIRRALEV
jgi:nucleoside-diphosphate-sugar epimerase